MCTSTGTNTDEVMDRVIGLVKKFDKIDASKVIHCFLLCFYSTIVSFM